MKNRTLLIVGVVALVLGLVGLAVGPVGARPWSGGWFWGHHAWMMGVEDHDEPPPEPIPGAETVEVRAFDFGFDPDRIVVDAGTPLNIRLTNDGFFFHDLTIPELGFHLNARPGESVVGGLAELAPGEYRFECTVPGHAEMGMVGVLVVEDGPTG